MSKTTEAYGIARYAERTPEQAERLAHLQDHRAGLRDVDAGLVSPTLEAVELVNGAASALEHSGMGGWSEGSIAKLRMVTNLLLALDGKLVDEHGRWFVVTELPFFRADSDAREIGRAVLRSIAREIEPHRAEVLYQAADLLRATPAPEVSHV